MFKIVSIALATLTLANCVGKKPSEGADAALESVDAVVAPVDAEAIVQDAATSTKADAAAPDAAK